MNDLIVFSSFYSYFYLIQILSEYMLVHFHVCVAFHDLEVPLLEIDVHVNTKDTSWCHSSTHISEFKQQQTHDPPRCKF